MKSILFFIIFIIPFSISAEEVKFNASGPSSVKSGERFRVTFEFNEHPSSFKAPDFSGFRMLSGPNQSTSTSIQIINGETISKQTISYTYILEAIEKGDFEIKPAKAIINGNNYQSNKISINVYKPEDYTPPTTDPSSPSDKIAGKEKELFVRASVDNKNPYQGEQVIITYKIYTKVPVRQYSIERLPSYRGFWSEDLTDRDQAGQQSTEIIDGQRYRTAEIRRVALFPQRAGSMKIEPLKVECFVRHTTRRRSSSRFDDFFSSHRGRSQTVQETIYSNKVNLNVKPLPTQKRPASFKGLVGNFQLSTSLENAEIQTNDATSLTVNISGNGNLRMAEAPEINFPANLEVYDPRTTDNINKTLSGVSGERKFEYLIIPRTEGELEIPPVKFSYFDPKNKEYKTLTGEKFTLSVKGGPTTAKRTNAVRKEDVKYIDYDIRHIYHRNINLQPMNVTFFRSPLFYILFALPVALFIIFIIYYYNKLKNKKNQPLIQTKQANKVAKKRLRLAGKLLNQNKDHAFYEEISRTLWGYISDKLNIPVSELNKKNIKEKLIKNNVPDDIANEFIETLDHCEFARFAPGNKEKNMAKVYSMSLETIVKIEKWLKRVED